MDDLEKVSIHVPAKGTTRRTGRTSPSGTVSIHVPAKGTTTYKVSERPADMFQSTFPRRERPFRSLEEIKILNGFNPRSREGNDRPWNGEWIN